MTVDVAAGLATYLTEAWGEPVEVADLSTTTAGARRHNVLFDATVGGDVAPARGDDRARRRDAAQPDRGRGGRPRCWPRRPGWPCPTSTSCRTDGELVGGPFMVSDFVAGETVPRRVLRLVAERGIGELVAAPARRVARPPPRRRPGRAPPCPLRALDGDGRRPPPRWRRSTQAVAVLPQPPAGARARAALARAAPPDAAAHARSILHTDVRNGNLIVGDDGLRAVLDWEGALASGDPMQDLAWPALRMWRFRKDEREVGGFAGRAPYVAGYEEAGGEFDDDRFRWWKVEGTLRWAVGLAGQAMAYLDGRVPEHRHGGQRPPRDASWSGTS